jgi:hypothetical protein
MAQPVMRKKYVACFMKAIAFAKQSNNQVTARECNITEKVVKGMKKNKYLLKVYLRINVPI